MTKQNKSSGNKHNDGETNAALTTIFNRIVRAPDLCNGEPVIKNTDISVDHIIGLFVQGYSDNEIRKKHGDALTKSDLDACRAYQVRFRPETLPPSFNIDEKEKFFFVDENISYMKLYKLAEIFGWCSHAEAEGFQGDGPHHDDEKDIFAHAVAENYKAILTADSDFIDIAQRHKEKMKEEQKVTGKKPGHSPVIIHIDSQMPRYEAIRLLKKYKEDITDFANQDRYPYAFLTEDGLRLDIPEKVQKCIKNKAQNAPPPAAP